MRQLLAQQREKLHSRGEGQQVVDRPTQQFGLLFVKIYKFKKHSRGEGHFLFSPISCRDLRQKIMFFFRRVAR